MSGRPSTRLLCVALPVAQANQVPWRSLMCLSGGRRAYEAQYGALVDSKQKPPSISAVWCPWCHVGLCWAYGETEVRKITGAWPPIFSACWFRSTAPGFRNWHLPVHMGILAHPRPCHRLAVPAAPHGPCKQQFALFFTAPRLCARFIYAKFTLTVMAQRLRRRTRTPQVAGSNPGECPFLLRFL